MTDSGVLARDVVADVAREVGETLGGFVPAAEQLGDHYLRSAGSATTVIEDAIGGAAWWVDAAGVTQVGARVPSTPAAGSWELLAYDPRSRVATLSVDDPTAIVVGSMLAEDRLPEELTVRSLELRVREREFRVLAWCGGTATSRSRVAGLLEAIALQASARRIWGRWRYRVQTLVGDRVNLQAVNLAAGIPDTIAVAMSPGVSGAHAKLALSAVVEVEFLEGDRALPRIVGFPGKGEVGHEPEELSLLGGTAPVAYEGCWVDVTIPTGTVLGENGSGPAITTVPVKLVGFVQNGRPKIKV
jgi:hypothetical protein